MTFPLPIAAFVCCGTIAFAADVSTFEKHTLTDKYYCDGINTGDFNRDGKADIVAGPYWDEGRGFTAKHEFYPADRLSPA